MKIRILLPLFFMACIYSLFGQEEKKAPTMEESVREYISRVAPKMKLTKSQTDSMTMIYLEYMDNLNKYHAEGNAKVISYMMKTREEKVKNLLRDSVKYEKYLMVVADLTRRPSQQPPAGDHPQGEHQGEHQGEGHQGPGRMR